MENGDDTKPEQDEELPEKSTSESYSDFSNTPASSRSGSQPASREDTPGVMPKYQYNKDDLIKLRDKPLSRSRPKCLSPDHDNTEGYWDPDIWIRRFGGSRGNSPLTTSGPRDRKRSTTDLERDVVFKRKSSVSDPKVRIKEEEEDGIGIVLSPQRRSFGTGCHVSIMPTRRPASPTEGDRDGHGQSHDQRKGSKIGSGRIQINHDRHEREYRETRSRYDRDDHRPPFDHPNPLDRFRRDDRGRGDRGRDDMLRDRDGPRDNRERLESRDSRDRLDSRLEGRDSRDRLESRDSRDRLDNRDRLDSRDSRDRLDPRDNRNRLDSRDSRDRHDWDSRDREMDDSKYKRDYDRRYERGMRRDYKRHEAEPEWFTGGPSSQSETIELHGFEDSTKDSSHSHSSKGVEAKRAKTSRESEPRKALAEKQPKKEEKRDSKKEEAELKKKSEASIPAERSSSRNENVGVADRNGSLETNESSSPEGSPQHAANTTPHGDPRHQPLGMQPLQNAPDFDFNEFFKIDNIPGLTEPSPVEQDPGASSGSRFRQWFQKNPGSHPGSRNDSRRSSINEEFSYLNDLLNLSGGQKSPVVPSPPLGFDPHRVMHRIPESKVAGVDIQQQQHNLMEMLKKAGSGQARLMASMGMNPQLPPELPRVPGKSMASCELEAMLMGNGQGTNVSQMYPPSQPPATMPTAAKVTTVSELEAGMKHLGLAKDGQLAAGISSANKQHLMEQIFPQQKKDPSHKGDVTSPTSPGNMAAFNKLLGMMKASGIIHEPPKMPRKQDGKAISPINVTAVPKDAMDNQQKDVLQRMLQQQQTKLIQQHQQQNKIQQVKQIQQQQQQQQQQKQVQDQIRKFITQNPGLMPKAGPSANSISPSLTLQPPPPSPRCPSPAIPQQALLQPQQSPSPRAPSPIMFGSQPPMHLTAPSPIHPSQQAPTSPNTLQVSQGSNARALQRVPSPQELIVHTQAIMQNALIKKQLEDQKERFIKKQQGRAKSPNPMAGGSMALMMPGVVSSGGNTSTPVAQAKLTPAFTPTSVIRKMVNDKVERDGEAELGSPEKKAPMLSLVRGMDSLEEVHGDMGSPSHSRSIPKVDTPPIMTVASDGSISIPVPITPKSLNKSGGGGLSDVSQSEAKSREMNSLSSMILSPPGGLPTSHAPPSSSFGGPSGQGFLPSQQFSLPMQLGSQQASSGQGKVPRALIGQGAMNTGMPMTMSSGLPVSMSAVMAQNSTQPSHMVSQAVTGNTAQGRAIVKGLGQTPQPPRPIMSGSHPVGVKLDQTTPPQPQQQRPIVRGQQQSSALNTTPQQTPPQGQMVRLPSNAARPVSIARPSPMGISPPTSSNNLMMQRMVQPANNTTGGFQQLGVNPLNPLSALQGGGPSPARPMDPRLQTGRNVYPINPLMASNSNPRGSFPLNSVNRALSPQPPMNPGVSLEGLNGPVTSGIMSHPNTSNLGALFGAHGAMDGNLAKWFNADMLKHQAPAMPPLPSQGQRVMTVDEIERRQQMVTN